MKNLIYVLIIFLMLGGCKEDCEKDKTGYLDFTDYSRVHLFVYDGEYLLLETETAPIWVERTTTFELIEGLHQIKIFTSVDGEMEFLEDYFVTIRQCEHSEFYCSHVY